MARELPRRRGRVAEAARRREMPRPTFDVERAACRHQAPRERHALSSGPRWDGGERPGHVGLARLAAGSRACGRGLEQAATNGKDTQGGRRVVGLDDGRNSAVQRQRRYERSAGRYREAAVITGRQTGPVTISAKRRQPPALRIRGASLSGRKDQTGSSQALT